MRLFKCLFIILFLFSFNQFAQAEESKKLKVVATFSILGDLIQNIAGDQIDLHVLVGPNGDAHTFEPTPQEAIILSQADLIFEIGWGFESWLNDLYASSKSKAAVMPVAAGEIDLIHREEEDADHDHFGHFDPHVWHDVSNTMKIVDKMLGVFIQLDPIRESFYRERADQYIKELKVLDQWIVEEVSRIPQDQRKLVTSHDTFGYFARAYGFELIGAAIHSSTTEASDPSAKSLADLIKLIRQAKVKAVFAENIKNEKLLKIVADEARVTLAPSLYTDALGEKGSAGDTYINMMQWNVQTIVENLGKE